MLKIIQKIWFKESSNSNKIKPIILETFFFIGLATPKLLIENLTSFEEKHYIRIFKESFSADSQVLQKASEILKILVQPAFIVSNPDFIQDIYDQILSYFVDLLHPNEIHDESTERVSEILGLLSHCLAVDTVSIRFFFISKNLACILNTLVKNYNTQIKIHALKVLKSIILRKDSFLINNIIKSDCLKIVFDLFPSNSTENLFSSCILSLLVEISNSDVISLNQYMSNLLGKYNSQTLNKFFTYEKKPEALEMRRSRSKSFDLTSQENFSELDGLDYNDFDLKCYGKRPSEGFAEPVKKGLIL